MTASSSTTSGCSKTPGMNRPGGDSNTMVFSRCPGALRGRVAEQLSVSWVQSPQAPSCPRIGTGCSQVTTNSPAPHPYSQLSATNSFPKGLRLWSLRRAGEDVGGRQGLSLGGAWPGKQPASYASGYSLADWPLDLGLSPWESEPSMLSIYFWLHTCFLFMLTF